MLRDAFGNFACLFPTLILRIWNIMEVQGRKAYLIYGMEDWNSKYGGSRKKGVPYYGMEDWNSKRLKESGSHGIKNS